MYSNVEKFQKLFKIFESKLKKKLFKIQKVILRNF